MKNRSLRGFLAIILLLGLISAGCGKKKGTSTATAVEKEKEEGGVNGLPKKPVAQDAKKKGIDSATIALGQSPIKDVTFSYQADSENAYLDLLLDVGAKASVSSAVFRVFTPSKTDSGRDALSEGKTIESDQLSNQSDTQVAVTINDGGQGILEMVLKPSQKGLSLQSQENKSELDLFSSLHLEMDTEQTNLKKEYLLSKGVALPSPVYAVKDKSAMGENKPTSIDLDVAIVLDKSKPGKVADLWFSKETTNIELLVATKKDCLLVGDIEKKSFAIFGLIDLNKGEINTQGVATELEKLPEGKGEAYILCAAVSDKQGIKLGESTKGVPLHFRGAVRTKIPGGITVVSNLKSDEKAEDADKAEEVAKEEDSGPTEEQAPDEQDQEEGFKIEKAVYFRSKN